MEDGQPQDVRRFLSKLLTESRVRSSCCTLRTPLLLLVEFGGKAPPEKTGVIPIAASKRICRVEEDEMRIEFLALIIFCAMLVTGCTTAPVRTPNVNDPSLMLPEQIMIEGIKIERGQSFRDCVPVALEAIFKFYGKNIDRKEIDERIHKSWGTYTKDWIE